MSDNVENEAADDWAAALAEQTGSAQPLAEPAAEEQPAEEQPAEDPPTPARRAPTATFEQFSPGPAKAAGTNDIDLILDRLDPGWNCRIENVKILDTKRHSQNFGAKRRAAHSHKQNVRESGAFYVFVKVVKGGDVAQFFTDDIEPAEPFGFVLAGPD